MSLPTCSKCITEAKWQRKELTNLTAKCQGRDPNWRNAQETFVH